MTKRSKSAQLSFAGGIFSEPLYSRADLSKYAIGLAECDNFIVRPQGSVENRAGFQFVDRVDIGSWNNVRAVPFVFSNDQAYVLVFEGNRVHFFLEGARLLDSANNPVILNTPITDNLIPDFDYAQSADTLIIVHENIAPFYIYRTGNPAAPFAWANVTFGPSVAPPTGLTGTAVTGGTADRTYLVTALTADGIEESLESAAVTVLTNWSAPGNTDEVRLQWNAGPGVQQCRVYKLQNGTFGLIGIADARYTGNYPWATQQFAFVDDLDLQADTLQTPPINPNWFNSLGDYPRSVCFYDQRLVFGGTQNEPQTIFMSKVGAPFNFTYHVPSQDNDSIKATIASTRQNEIRYLVPTSDLLIMTDSSQWKVGTYNDAALTPDTISIRPQGQDGTARVKPLVTGSSVLFIDRTKGRVMSMEFDIGQNVYKAQDISIIAYQIFKDAKVVDMAELPDDTRTVWFALDNGEIAICTYLPEQQVIAFSKVITDGKVRTLTHIPDNDGERIYIVVERNTSAGTRLYCERLALRRDDLVRGEYLDSFLTLDSATPVTTVSGLDHLEGRHVRVMMDGSVEGLLTVSGGQITLPAPANHVIVGLPYESRLKTLPLYLANAPGFGIGDLKNVTRVHIKTYRTKHVMAYAGAGNPAGYTDPINPSNILGVAVPLRDEVLNVSVASTFNDDGQVQVFQKYPLPTTILSLALEFSAGA